MALTVVGLVALAWPRASSAPLATAPIEVSNSAPAPTPAEAVASLPEDTEPTAALPETTAAVPTSPSAAATAVAAAPRPTPRPAPQVVRVRIPALGVDAPIQQMGFDAACRDGGATNAATVAWYGFTAMPGDLGNAVLAGHVTWGGSRAVFNQLSALHAGDSVEVRTGDGDVRYVVQRLLLLQPEDRRHPGDHRTARWPRDVDAHHLRGSFDPTVREYDHRVIVFATRA
ncbi:MAG: sortase [Dehalococcoidia bacterium]